MEHEQGRKHPGIRVPEYVPVVARARESHRRDALVRALARAGEQVEQHRVNDALQLGVSLHDDVRLPQAVAGGGVVGDEGAVPARHGASYYRARPRQRIGSVARPRDAHELRECDGLARRGVKRDFGLAVSRVPEPGRPRQLLRHAHAGRPALGACQDRQRIPGGRDEVPGIPDRVERPLRLGALQARERESPGRRPFPQREPQRDAPGVLRDEAHPDHGEVRIGARHERGDLDGGALRAMHPLVPRGEGAVVQIECLAVSLQRARIWSGIVQPAVAVRHVELVPRGERGDAGYVARRVIGHPGSERERRRGAERRADQAERAVADEGGGAVRGVGRREDEGRGLGG